MGVIGVAVTEQPPRVPGVFSPTGPVHGSHVLANGVAGASLDGSLSEPERVAKRREPIRTDVYAEVVLLVTIGRFRDRLNVVLHGRRPTRVHRLGQARSVNAV